MARPHQRLDRLDLLDLDLDASARVLVRQDQRHQDQLQRERPEVA